MKLLSPLKALNRLKGVLPPADELPSGVPLPSQPLWLELATVLQYKCIKKVPTKEGSHINIDELKNLLVTECLAAQDSFPARFFSLADSQVALGAVLKGRSSSLGLNSFVSFAKQSTDSCWLWYGRLLRILPGRKQLLR